MITDDDLALLMDTSKSEDELKIHFSGRKLSRRDIQKLRPFILRRFGEEASHDLLIDIFGLL